MKKVKWGYTLTRIRMNLADIIQLISALISIGYFIFDIVKK